MNFNLDDILIQTGTVGVLLKLLGTILVSVVAYYIFKYAIHIYFNKYKVNYELDNIITNSYENSKCTVKIKIATQLEIMDQNLKFVILLAEKLQDKPQTIQQITKDPFLPPYEPGIFISNITDTHVLLLNKFSLVKNHVLIVTKNFNKQFGLLNRSDFEACIIVIRALKGISFYNSGPQSGHSQYHKHMQVIPISSLYTKSIYEAIQQMVSSTKSQDFMKFDKFRFKHIICCLPKLYSPKYASKILKNIFFKAMIILGNQQCSFSYNCIFTEKWLLIVLRSKKHAFGCVSLNSQAFLGRQLHIINLINFKGSFAVSDYQMLQKLKVYSPLRILEDVCISY